MRGYINGETKPLLADDDGADMLFFGKIIISDSPFSPFRGDINLYIPAESASFMAFHCAPLILINALIDHVGMLDRDTSLKALDRFEKMAAEKKYFL